MCAQKGWGTEPTNKMHRQQIAIFVKIKCALYRKDEPMGAAGTVPTKTLCWELCVGCACKLQKATGKVLPNDWFPSRVIPNPPWSAATKLHRDTAKVQIWQTSNLYFGYRKGFCRTCDRASNNLSEEQPAYQLPSWWQKQLVQLEKKTESILASQKG